MKHLLLTTIAAVVLVGCGKPDGPLIQAARTGNHEAVKQHLAAGADVNGKGDFGRTPLDLAVEGDQKEAAELLIANGANVNAKNNSGWTPLHRTASYHGRKEFVEVAELLIANGADVNPKTDDGRTPLDFSIQYEQTETASLLRKHGGKTGAELKAEGK